MDVLGSTISPYPRDLKKRRLGEIPRGTRGVIRHGPRINFKNGMRQWLKAPGHFRLRRRVGTCVEFVGEDKLWRKPLGPKVPPILRLRSFLIFTK